VIDSSNRLTACAPIASVDYIRCGAALFYDVHIVAHNGACQTLRFGINGGFFGIGEIGKREAAGRRRIIRLLPICHPPTALPTISQSPLVLSTGFFIAAGNNTVSPRVNRIGSLIPSTFTWACHRA